jgi:23S rRNA (cytosine1962-C5)-methyltransferase
MPPSAVISRRGVDRIHAGHPWIYRSDVLSTDAAPGDLVRVTTERERPVGWALWSSASQIALRMVSTDRTLDEATFWRERLAAALAYRKTLAIDSNACRLVHGEADRLPGLVVDRYHDVLVLQTLAQGTDRRLEVLTGLLVELVQPRGVLARNDPKVRRLEGLDERVDVVFGEVPDVVEITEGAIRCEVDLRHGQKTGWFLDQRENHLAASAYARGRALDAFAYQGGFALQMAARCESVLALDASEAAVAAMTGHARRNGLSNIEAREVNAFDELRELEIADHRFETIVLDPPAFAKNKAAVPRALAGYKEINLRALKLLEPGGHLITCSCSYNVDEARFQHVVLDAALDARASVVLVEKRMQARDHPVLLGVPETHYLKCLILRKLA